jgi:glycosyltransferase involved in cell wall biosynthesis
MKILLVSLIHNRASLLSDCVMSAVNQTLPKTLFSHLLLDNASTDNAPQIAKMFAKKYPHVKFESMSSNVGQMPAYNWVLNVWAPKYEPDALVMAQVDSDDRITTIALEEVYNKFRSNNDLIQTYSDFSVIDGAGRVKIKAHPKAKQVDPSIELTQEGQSKLMELEVRTNNIGHMRALRMDYLREIGGFDETYRYATDVNMACRSLSSKYKVAKIPKVLYEWRQHGDQVEGSVSVEQTACWESLRRQYAAQWNVRL